MNLEELYQQIYNNIKKINFDSIWKGFAPTKFALYNESECFFDGRYIEKTADFVANTAIFYEGEYIAIWNVIGTPNITVLTSKIIHEMFHAFQYANHWDICVNELKALIYYKYDEENLSIKLRENKLLLDLYKCYDAEKAETFARYRKYRQEKFPYEFQYESSIEKLEGSANYIEWQALKQLDSSKADELFASMTVQLSDCGFYFPIRISNYYSGALFCAVQFTEQVKSVFEANATGESIGDISCNSDSAMKEAVLRYAEETERIVAKALASNKVIIEEPVELLGVNVYNARRYKQYLTSTYFLMYLRNGKEEILNGNFIIKMLDDKTIEKVYEWDLEEG